MRKLMTVCLLLMASYAGAGVMAAQDAPKPAEAAKTAAAARYYHLLFVIEELNAAGKPTNSRSYTTTVSTAPDEYASIRSGSRVPIVSGTMSSEGKEVNTQFQYIDLGANIDARHAHEVDRKLSLNISAEITSMAAALDAHLHEPVIRQNKWNSIVLIPVGKATTIFTSDALDSTGSMRMVVTATEID